MGTTNGKKFVFGVRVVTALAAMVLVGVGAVNMVNGSSTAEATVSNPLLPAVKDGLMYVASVAMSLGLLTLFVLWAFKRPRESGDVGGQT